jgi:hypothetical protein
MVNHDEHRKGKPESPVAPIVDCLGYARWVLCEGFEAKAGQDTHRPSSAICRCRIVGCTTMFGVSAYIWAQRATLPPSQMSNRPFMAAMSGLFLVLGVARAVY